MDYRLFRKQALDNVASPEDLETMIRVTSPRGWIALSAAALLLLAIVLWAFFGSIHETVSGHGILIREGGIRRLTALSGGTVGDIAVSQGSRIQQGDLIAQIDQPDLAANREALQTRLDALQEDLTQLKEFHRSEQKLETTHRTEQLRLLDQSRTYHKERIEALRDRLQNETELHQEGLLTAQSLLRRREELANEELALLQLDDRRTTLEIRQTEAANQRHRERTDLLNQINLLQRDLAAATERLRLHRDIRAPFAGRVVEITTHTGDVVPANHPVALVELGSRDAGNRLRMVGYIPAVDAKRLQSGMATHIAPSTARKEEFGQILATLTSVSEFPATPEGILGTLNNPSLVQSMTTGGAVIRITAELQTSPDTVSGYQWTSAGGAPVQLRSGTLCKVSVVALSRRPASMVFPFLRKTIMGE